MEEMWAYCVEVCDCVSYEYVCVNERKMWGKFGFLHNFIFDSFLIFDGYREVTKNKPGIC
jgi:hypothetical protein